MRLLYFGRLADLAGTRSEDVELPPEVGTVAALRFWLAETRPELREALYGSIVRALIDDAYARDDQSLDGVAGLAFIPPVSGG